MKQPTLYILCGYPFAGKSTLARALTDTFKFSLVSTDIVNTERGIGLHGEAITKEEWKKTYHEVYKRIEQLLQYGETVLYDDCNFTKKQRDVARKIAYTQKASFKIIYINTSKEDAIKRWHENKRTKTRFDIRDEDFSQVADNFKPPTQEESVIIYDTTTSLEEWIEKEFS